MTHRESSSAQRPGRVAGIDYGTVRIGIALSDPDRTIASPHENYTRRGEESDARRFCRLVEEEGVELFVVGLPVHSDGGESRKSQEARTFGAWLHKTTGVDVVFFDERYTSVEAEQLLLDADMTRRRRRRRLDMLAAQIMLAAFLESDKHGQDKPGSLG
ncbi:MAG: Holliday junction resolvase RuvX [Pirellulales bacterium]|nr:Holliday junction resolvase RuvX [Pirellulales bacterium]